MPLNVPAQSNRALHRRAFLGGAAALGGASMLAACQTTAAAPRTYPALQALLDRYVTERKFAGAMIAVQKNGALTYLTAGKLAFGDANPAPDENTLYRVFSMTKPITAIAGMQLIDRGRLTLDTPLADILPEFANMRVLENSETRATRLATSPIVIRNLLTHTAGFTYHMNDGMGVLPTIYKENAIVPIGPATLLDANLPRQPATLEEFGAKLATLPLDFDPGARWQYSVALDVLGLVIQRVSGKPFERYLAEEVFQPLDMRDATFSVAPENRARFATNYWNAQGMGLVPFDRPETSPYVAYTGMPCGGAGLIMTTRDYARFQAMLLNEGALDGTRVLSRSAARQVGANLMPGGAEAFPKSGFGAGMRVAITDEDMDAWPRGAYGWGGAAGTVQWIEPHQKAAVVFMTQYMNIDYPLNRELGTAAAQDFAA